MSDLFHVTIVAKPPNETFGPLQADQSGFVDGVLAKLRRGSGPKPVRAASIQDLDEALLAAEKKAGNRQLSVQVIGHGAPGLLELGRAYMKSPQKAARSPFFGVDTTPDLLRAFPKHAGRIAELKLLGCSVGASDPESWPLNGRGLTYCFSEILQCHVVAPSETISPDDFDETGTYTGAGIAWSYVSPGPPTWTADNVARSAHDGAVEKLEADRIVSTRLPTANRGPFEFRMTIPVVPIASKHLRYATPEVTIRLKDKRLVSIVGNGRFIVGSGAQYLVRDHNRLTNAASALLFR
jgi:hypothetical protein